MKLHLESAVSATESQLSPSAVYHLPGTGEPENCSRATFLSFPLIRNRTIIRAHTASSFSFVTTED